MLAISGALFFIFKHVLRKSSSMRSDIIMHEKKNYQFLQCKMLHEILISRLYNLAVKELFRIICRFAYTDSDQKHQPTLSIMWSFTNKCWIILSIRFSSIQNTLHLTSRLNRNSSVNRICLQQHCFQTRCSIVYLLWAALLLEINGIQILSSLA